MCRALLCGAGRSMREGCLAAVSHLQQISERILFLKKPYQKAALQQLLTGMSD